MHVFPIFWNFCPLLLCIFLLILNARWSISLIYVNPYTKYLRNCICNSRGLASLTDVGLYPKYRCACTIITVGRWDRTDRARQATLLSKCHFSHDTWAYVATPVTLDSKQAQYSQHHRRGEWSHRYTCIDYSQQSGTIPSRLEAFPATDRKGLPEICSWIDALWSFPLCLGSGIIPERGWNNVLAAFLQEMICRRTFLVRVWPCFWVKNLNGRTVTVMIKHVDCFWNWRKKSYTYFLNLARK